VNYNNFAQKTNWVAGSNKFENIQFYLTTLNIPGINFNHPDVGSRGSAKLNLTGDTLTYNNLSFEFLIDEDFNVYKEFMKKIKENISIENASFANIDFDFWVQLNNNKGNKILKFNFTNCRIESIGDINLDTTDDATEQTLSVEVKFDYYEIEDINLPTIRV